MGLHIKQPIKYLALALVVCCASCARKWDNAAKDSFYTACTETARKDWAPTDSIAKSYCDCVFQKMSARYPTEEEALEHIDQLAKDSALINCRKQMQ